MTYPGPAEIHVLELKGTAREGKLKLTVITRSTWVINAIAIVPVKEYAQVKKNILDPEHSLLGIDFVSTIWHHQHKAGQSSGWQGPHNGRDHTFKGTFPCTSLGILGESGRNPYA
jgi:hypothetical protein